MNTNEEVHLNEAEEPDEQMPTSTADVEAAGEQVMQNNADSFKDEQVVIESMGAGATPAQQDEAKHIEEVAE